VKPLTLILAAACLLWLTGCEEATVTTYEVQTEAPKGWPTANHSRQTMASQQAQPVGSPAAGTASGTAMQATPAMEAQSAQFQTPQWQAPAGWEPQPLGSIRKGSWKISRDGQTAEVAVTVFPGDVGGTLANVNRWARQIGAPALNAPQLAELEKENTIQVDGLPALLVYLEGNQGKHISGVIAPRNNATWFFKMTGDAALVKDEGVPFGQFMASVRFQ